MIAVILFVGLCVVFAVVYKKRQEGSSDVEKGGMGQTFDNPVYASADEVMKPSVVASVPATEVGLEDTEYKDVVPNPMPQDSSSDVAYTDVVPEPITASTNEPVLFARDRLQSTYAGFNNGEGGNSEA